MDFGGVSKGGKWKWNRSWKRQLSEGPKKGPVIWCIH
jgi:hypothetical protein